MDPGPGDTRPVTAPRDVARRAVADGTFAMMVGTVVAGVATYAWQAAGARLLGEVAFAPVASVWTLMFLMITVLIAPVEQYTIRSVAAAGDRSQLVRAMPTILRLAVAATVVVAVLAWALRGPLFDGDAAYAAVCVAILVGFGQLAVIRGTLAGERDFAAYGWITGLDSCLRLAVGVPLLLGGASGLAFAWTVPLCSVVALGWLRRRSPPTAGPRPGASADAADVEAVAVGPARFIAHTVGGTVPSQMILAGSPLVVALLGADEAAITTLFVTQTAFRAAFLVATPGWSRVLPVLTRHAVAGDHGLLRRLSWLLVFATLAVSAAGGLVAAVAAPPVVALLFGEGTRPGAVVAGLSMAGTLAAVGNLGLTTLLVARARTRAITVAWWTALATAAAVVVAVPAAPTTRVVVAFAVGEAVAALGLGAAARAAASGGRASRTGAEWRRLADPSVAAP